MKRLEWNATIIMEQVVFTRPSNSLGLRKEPKEQAFKVDCGGAAEPEGKSEQEHASVLNEFNLWKCEWKADLEDMSRRVGWS